MQTTLVRIFALFIFSLPFVSGVHAAGVVSCSDVFPSPVSMSSNKTLEIKNNSQIYGSDEGKLHVGEITHEGGHSNSCPQGSSSQTCVAQSPLAESGEKIFIETQGGGSDISLSWGQDKTVGGAGDDYPTNNLKKIELGGGGTLTFSSENNTYYIHSIKLGYTDELILAPGTYWIKNDVALGSSSSISVAGTGAVKIFIGGSLTMPNQSSISASSPTSLALYVAKNLTMGSTSEISGIVYVAKTVALSDQAEIHGALHTEQKGITLGSASYVRGGTDIADLDFAPLCGSGVEPIPPPECGDQTLVDGLTFSTYDSRPWNDASGGWGWWSWGGPERSPANADEFQEVVDRQATEDKYFGSSIVSQINGGGLGVNPHPSDNLSENQQDYYLGVFSGFLEAPESGTYQFAIDGDDAVEVLINDVVVTGYYGLHARANRPTNQVSLHLDRGWHRVEFRYHEHEIHEYFYLYWQRPSETALSIIPSQHFKTCDGDVPIPPVAGVIIDANAIGLSCANHSISVSATLDGVIDESYVGSVSLSSSSGNGVWSIGDGQGSLAPGSAGAAVYTFVGDDKGQVELSLFHALEGSTMLTAQDGVASDNHTVDFKAFGFKTTVSGHYGDNPHISNTDANLVLTAVGKDESGEGCAQIDNYHGDKAISFWSSYQTPDSGNKSLSVQSSPVGKNEASATNIAIKFENGQSEDIVLRYPDAGQIAVNFWDKNDSLDDEGLQTLRGSVNVDWVPSHFIWLDVVSGSGLTNPDGTASSGEGFVAAGDTFNATLVAINACSYSDLSSILSHCVTENFSLPSASGLNVSHELNTPLLVDSSGGSSVFQGELTVPDASWSNGESAYTGLAWSEVGSIALQATLDSYLTYTFPLVDSAGNTFSPQGREDIGRFYPHHYALTASSIDAACINFTYFGQRQQQLSWSIDARNASDAQLRNYDSATDYKVHAIAEGGEVSDHWLLSGMTDTEVNQRWQTDVLPQLWEQGTFDAVLLNSGLSKLEGVLGEEPKQAMDISLVLIDQDGAKFDCNSEGHCSLGSAPEFRHGRLWLQNAYGSELQAIAVNAETQYYLLGRYTLNTDDHCSDVSENKLNVSPEAIAVPPLLSAVATVGAGTSLVGVREAMVADGVLWFDFSAPGKDNTGEIRYWLDLGADNLWLRDDYDGSGDFSDSDDEAGAGLISFGIYRQNDRIIYRQGQY